jgi:adenosylcobinamide-GDP ribazoletransferase
MSARERVRAALWQVRLAASFLTIIPLAGGPARPPTEVAASLRWFPLIGYLIGTALVLEDRLLAVFTGGAIRAALIVITLEIVSGGMHLDGLADTADALGAGRDRERALEIMRDSHIGTFGAAAIFAVLALKTLALAQAHGGARIAAIYAAPGLARWAMAWIGGRSIYLRAQGAGTALLDGGESNPRIASIIAAIGMIPAAGCHALRAIVTAALLAAILRKFYDLWLGGVTGDPIGAGGQIVETAVMIAMTN